MLLKIVQCSQQMCGAAGADYVYECVFTSRSTHTHLIQLMCIIQGNMAIYVCILWSVSPHKCQQKLHNNAIVQLVMNFLQNVFKLFWAGGVQGTLKYNNCSWVNCRASTGKYYWKHQARKTKTKCYQMDNTHNQLARENHKASYNPFTV
jgi:hypothetical protein